MSTIQNIDNELPKTARPKINQNFANLNADKIEGGQNAGTGVGQIFKDVVNKLLRFKGIKAGNAITVTDDGTDITINATAAIADASTTVKGIGEVSVAPASPTTPIFVGDNDPRVPTQNENDALTGTSGTAVSSSNKLVDAADADTAATAGKIVRRITGGQVTVPSTPSNTTDATSKNYVDNGLNSKVAGFGAWAGASADGAGHQVTTDGILVGYASGNSFASITIKTDSSSTPTTTKMIANPSSTGNSANFTCPVRKSDYYSITVGGSPAAAQYSFIPLS